MSANATDCPTRAFGACNCTDPCQSASERLRQINEAMATVQAKRNADRAMLTFAAVLAIAGLVFATGYTLSKMERQYQLEARI